MQERRDAQVQENRMRGKEKERAIALLYVALTSSSYPSRLPDVARPSVCPASWRSAAQICDFSATFCTDIVVFFPKSSNII